MKRKTNKPGESLRLLVLCLLLVKPFAAIVLLLASLILSIPHTNQRFLFYFSFHRFNDFYLLLLSFVNHNQRKQIHSPQILLQLMILLRIIYIREILGGWLIFFPFPLHAAVVKLHTHTHTPVSLSTPFSSPSFCAPISTHLLYFTLCQTHSNYSWTVMIHHRVTCYNLNPCFSAHI
jgi:hypothetical protein